MALIFMCERQKTAQETAEEEKQKNTSDDKNKRKVWLWSRAVYGAAGDGTHWAYLEKLLVLAFDIITVALTERPTPSGGV